MGVLFSKSPSEHERQNIRLSAEIMQLGVEMEKMKRALLAAEIKHKETMIQLNATREALLREQEHIRRKEAEVEHLKGSGVELATIVNMYSEIDEDRQRIIDKLDEVNREQEDSQLEQKNLLKKLTEEYAENEKKMAETQEEFKKNLAEMIQLQKTMPAIQSVKKLVNTLKLILKNVNVHSKNTKKLVEVVGKLQCDLETQIMDVHSHMLEGHVTRDAVTVFVDASLFNTQMVEFLALHGVVDRHAVIATKEFHQEEWQQVMAARRRFYPLTDQQTPELEYMFSIRFRTANILSTRGFQNSSSSAAAPERPVRTNLLSSDPGLAAELEGLTVDEVSSTPSGSGIEERSPFQEDRGPQAMEKEVFQGAAALLSALEEGLESGRFDKDGAATEDQDATAVVDNSLVPREKIYKK